MAEKTDGESSQEKDQEASYWYCFNFSTSWDLLIPLFSLFLAHHPKPVVWPGDTLRGTPGDTLA